ncbi:Very short patch repair protein [anaerobic digester metagenome]
MHGKIPKSNQEYWKAKLQKNVVRDAKNIAKLKELGWNVVVIWECEVDSVELDIFFK